MMAETLNLSEIADLIPNSTVQTALELLIKEWEQKNNVNAFLFSYFILKEPIFVSDNIMRTLKTKKNYFLKKSLLDRLSSKLMSYNKVSGGKKLKIKNLLVNTLAKTNLNLEPSLILLLLLVKTVPCNDIRRQKYGSGHLTRTVRLTVARKISWFLKVIAELMKNKTHSFEKTLLQEITDVFNNASKSLLLTRKKESEQNALKSNIQ